MGNISRKDDHELIWAKLNGQWDDFYYRLEMTFQGKYLDILKDDSDHVIRFEAQKALSRKEQWEYLNKRNSYDIQ